MKRKRLTPRALLDAAKKTPTKEQYYTAKDLLPVIIVLNKKGYTWKEVQAWFAERGHRWNAQSIGNTFRHHQSERKG